MAVKNSVDIDLEQILIDLDLSTPESSEETEIVEPPEIIEKPAIIEPTIIEPTIIEPTIVSPKPQIKSPLKLKSPKPITPIIATKTKELPKDGVQSTSNLDKLTNKHHTVFDELLDNMRSDRNELSEFINIYAVNVQSEAPKQSYVEGLVSLLSTKAKISSDAVKLLDSNAKMLAASKSIAVNEKGRTTSESELEHLMNDFDPTAP